MFIDILAQIVWALWPLAAVLVLEHMILTYRYKKRSSLSRIANKLSGSSKTDLAFTAINYTPWSFAAYVAQYLTLPGLLLYGLVILDRTVAVNGLLATLQPSNKFLAFACWLLVIDFGHYLAHVLMHKIPFLWKYHKLHHAVEEMNIIAGVRVSFGERAINALVIYGLLTMLFGFLQPADYVLLILAKRVVDFIQHSDLPWDYGPLGYVIAGPRYHRMHHSNSAEDYDANYADLFSMWDYAFGTTSSRYKNSSKIADQISLGLATDTETKRYNDWRTAIFHGTILDDAWRAIQYIRAKTPKH